MASFTYLWEYRAKFPLNSKSFYRAWVKRILLIPELVQRNRHRRQLTRAGAQIHRTAEIGNVVIEGHRAHLSIGSSTFLGQVTIALHCSVRIGSYVCINDGVRVLSASHDVLDPSWGLTLSEVQIDDYVWIGVGAIILPGVHLGRGAVVGAGAVVSKSVVPGGIVVGNPAKLLSKVRPEKLCYNPCEFLASNRAWLIG